MEHDFKSFHAEKGCDKQGFMSYGGHLMGWSECSRTDFLVHYNEIESKYGWCMPGKIDMCTYA